MKKFKSVHDELIYISKQNNGFCNPKKVLEFAENTKTHLHQKFEWDNEKAGYAYRLWQARQIISLEFQIIESGNNAEKETRLFVSLKDDRKNSNGYRLVTDVLNDEELTAQMLNEALAELIRIKTKYGMLKELAGVFKEIEKVQELEMV